MPISLAVGGNPDEDAEKKLLEDLKRLVEKHRGAIEYAGWHGTSTGRMNLRESITVTEK
jgi:hypothetical protein